MAPHPKLAVTGSLTAAMLGSVALAQSCSTSPSPDAMAQVAPPPPSAKPPEGLAPERKRLVEDELRRIAQDFTTYARVSDDLLGWAPESCRGPDAPSAFLSVAPDASAHGRKLYALYARDKACYMDVSYPRRDAAGKEPPRVSPVGQVVVKQAFTPIPAESDRPKFVELERAFRNDPFNAPTAELVRYAEDDHGKLFKAGDLSGLFVMLKLDPKTPGTDQGWVYATIDKDLTTITSMGVIESCMNCHKQTDRDRLYGHKYSWPKQWPDAKATPTTPTTTTAPR